jgi:CRISP-associated protein Cas1
MFPPALRYVYFPRLFYYEWVEGVFAHSADTMEGALRHEKLETTADPLPAAEETGDRIHSRSVQLSSEAHHLIATIDLVEGEHGHAIPVDYKQRVRVALDDELAQTTLAAISAAREAARCGAPPAPLLDSPKCAGCALVGICLPDETAAMCWPPEEDEGEQLPLFDREAAACWPLEQASGQMDEVRRLVPMRNDLRPPYVTGHGFTIGKSGDVLQIRDRKQMVQEVRLREISQLNVFGNVQLTSSAVQASCWAEKPIAHFLTGGWFYGFTQGLGLKNVFLRRAQFARTRSTARSPRVGSAIPRLNCRGPIAVA